MQSENPLQCPKCNAPMNPVQFEDVEVDRCSECSGLWFDALEHEQLKTRSGSESIDVGEAGSAERGAHSGSAKCPRCNVSMISMVVNGQAHIHFESCTTCHGVYFDSGEFKDFKEKTLLETVRELLRI